MSDISKVSHLPSAFDKVAISHWQNYKAGTPIGGGMAYEERVRACRLDGSMDSLKMLDALLSDIKEDIKRQQLGQSGLLKQSAFRHFMLFISFYVGKVLTYQHGITGSWLGFESLTGRYRLTVGDSKFYATTAFVPNPQQNLTDLPFFVLMTVGAGLFGTQFIHPITQQPISSSLYWATIGYVDDVKQAPTQNPTPKQTPNTDLKPPKTSQIKQSPKPTKSPKNKKNSLQAHAKNFAEVKADLVTMPAANTAHQSHHQKAMAVIDKVAHLMQDSPDKIAHLTDKQKQTVSYAITLLTKVANAGNTDAMLSLALCYFEGVGIASDDKVGFEWVQKAANMNDVRAQKLLSRLYYQGIGTDASTELGKLWLHRAADNGHSEAKKLVAHFTQIQSMQDDIKTEAEQDKKYLIWGAAIGGVLIVILWVFAKMVKGG